MMRVMVVEDEEMIRKGIVMAVDWAALDCIVVGRSRQRRTGPCRRGGLPADAYHHGSQNAEDGRAGDGAAAARSRQPRVCHHSDRLRFVRLRADGHPSGRGGLSAEAFS